jgi:integrase
VPIGFYENGNPIQKPIGCFSSRFKAEVALTEYFKDPAKFDADKTTFEDLFKGFWKDKFTFEYGKKETKLSQVEYSYSTAFNNCESLHNKIYTELNKNDYEKVIADITNKGLKASSISNLKKLWNGMNDFSKVGELKEEGYKAVKMPEFEASSTHKAFLSTDIKKVFNCQSNNKYYDTIPVLLYTGMRISELLTLLKENVNLEKRYMIGGMKTSAGRNRIIPIHEKILPIINKWMQTKGKTLFPDDNGGVLKYNWYFRYVWTPISKELNTDYLPHDTRHTFISQAERCNLKPLLIKRIVGHASQNITHDVYTHTEAEELVREMDMFSY